MDLFTADGMRRILPLVIATFGCTSSLFAQNTFEIDIPLNGITNVIGGQPHPEGGFVFAGARADGLFVLRTDSTGDVLWTRTLAEGANEEGNYGNSLAVTADGILLGGYAMGPNTSTRDGLLYALGLDGTLLSQQLIDIAGGSNAVHAMTPIEDGALVVGRTDVSGSYDMLLQHVDATGAVVSSRSYGSAEWDWAYQAIRTADGGNALVGYGDGVGGPAPSAYLVRTDGDGAEIWARGLDGASADEGYCVMEDVTTGDLFIGGTSLGMGSVGTHGFISKFSPDGTHSWTSVIGNAFDVIGIITVTEGRFMALARAQDISGGHGAYDALLMLFDTDGTLLDSRLYGSTDDEYPVSLAPAGDDGVLVTSYRTSAGVKSVHAVLTTRDLPEVCSGTSVDVQWTPYTPTIYYHTSTFNEGSSTSAWSAAAGTLTAERFFLCCTYPVSAAFTAVPGEGNTVTLTNQSQGTGVATWTIDNDEFTGDVLEYTFPAAGNYTVCLTIDGICAQDTQCEPVVVLPSGVGEGAVSPVTLAPSPATDHARATVPAGVRLLEVLDLNGRLVRQWATNGARVLDLDLSELPAGMWLLRVHGQDGIGTQRFAKD